MARARTHLPGRCLPACLLVTMTVSAVSPLSERTEGSLLPNSERLKWYCTAPVTPATAIALFYGYLSHANRQQDRPRDSDTEPLNDGDPIEYAQRTLLAMLQIPTCPSCPYTPSRTARNVHHPLPRLRLYPHPNHPPLDLRRHLPRPSPFQTGTSSLSLPPDPDSHFPSALRRLYSPISRSHALGGRRHRARLILAGRWFHPPI